MLALNHKESQKRLFGIGKLENYDHNISAISRMSYNYYRANGNKYKLPNMDLRSKVEDAEAGISLPHCISAESWLNDEKTANKQFCTQNSDSKEIFSSEAWTRIITTVPGAIAHNLEIRCQQ